MEIAVITPTRFTFLKEEAVRTDAVEKTAEDFPGQRPNSKPDYLAALLFVATSQPYMPTPKSSPLVSRYPNTASK